MVESTSLLTRRPLTGTVGSNPTVSAKVFRETKISYNSNTELYSLDCSYPEANLVSTLRL